MKRLTREWIRKAESDYRLAAKIAKGSEPFHDQCCFHCQQSAEKYLKALMQESGLNIPRTHILTDLANLLTQYQTDMRPLSRGMTFLTRFSVATRYPGGSATKRQAESALRWAGRVRRSMRSLLGLPGNPPRRK